jgi:hypothetical protein
MSSEVMMSVPADFAAQITAQAQRSGQSVADTLLSFLAQGQQQTTASMRGWTDEAVLAAADLALPESQDARLSELLNLQSASKISPKERSELRNLMEIFRAAQLHKARGMGEAIRRGLRNPPEVP